MKKRNIVKTQLKSILPTLCIWTIRRIHSYHYHDSYHDSHREKVAMVMDRAERVPSRIMTPSWA